VIGYHSPFLSKSKELLWVYLVLFANLSLFALEKNAWHLPHFLPFLTRYIDDILVPTHLSLNSTITQLALIYKDSGLKFTATPKHNDNTVFLDLQI
jgi:hypothetical protein